MRKSPGGTGQAVPPLGRGEEPCARVYRVRGRVQGVGFRNFVQQVARSLPITGCVRNLDDGGVEVYAVALPRDHDTLAGLLHQGPRWAEVRSVEVAEAAVIQYEGFRITY